MITDGSCLCSDEEEVVVVSPEVVEVPPPHLRCWRSWHQCEGTECVQGTEWVVGIWSYAYS